MSFSEEIKKTIKSSRIFLNSATDQELEDLMKEFDEVIIKFKPNCVYSSKEYLSKELDKYKNIKTK